MVDIVVLIKIVAKNIISNVFSETKKDLESLKTQYCTYLSYKAGPSGSVKVST